MKKICYSAFFVTLLLNAGASLAQTTTRFNDGYITIYKATSAAALTNTGTAVVAEEFNPNTAAQSAPNYSVAIPTTGSNRLVVSGSATASGGMSRSENGRYLLMPGYSGSVGDANTTFTTNGAVRTIDASGTVGDGISAGGTLWLSGNNNLRGATSDDGTNYWITGNGVGIQTSSNGTTITTVSSTTTNNRTAAIYNGQLYLTTGAGSQGIYSIGSGTPVTGGQTGTRLFTPANTDVYAFSISPDAATIYYVASSGGGIYRSTFNGTTWSGGTQIFSGSGYTGIAVDWNSYTFNASAANGARIYACNPSTLVAANDNGTAVAGTTVLRTEPSPSGNAFRQLAFSPSKQTVSLGAGSPAAGNILTAATNVVLFQFSLSADEGNSTLKKVMIDQSGTATIGAGNDISNFQLIDDANNNGIADAAELSAPLSAGTVSGSTITFSNINLAAYINEGNSRNFIITGDVSAMATAGNTFIPGIVSNKILNGINYTTNISNAGNSWVTTGATPPSGNVLTIGAPVSTSFTAGNIVVVQTSGAASKGGSAVNLNEYTTSGTPAVSIAMDAAGATPFQIAAGPGGSEGFLTRTPDGTALMLAGYSTAVTGISDITVTAASTTPRVIFKADGTGAYTQVGSSTVDYSGNDIRGAISDGTNYWASGASVAGVDGIDYYGPGAAAALATSAKAYGLHIFGGQIYFSTQKVVAGVTPDFGIYALGSGTPTSGSITPTEIINTGTATPTDFSFNPTGDICYIAINMNSTAGGIQKWIKTGGTWSLAYTLGTGVTNIGAFGLVADYTGTNPVIYATTFESNVTGNRIITITDTGAASAAATLVTGTANTFFHGIEFAPSATCMLPAQPAAFTAATDTVYNGQSGVTYTVPNDPSVSYAWSYSGSGATISGSGNSVNISFSAAATSGTLSVVATNACGSGMAETKNIFVLPLPGTMRITEYMYNGNGSGSAGEFVEFTNVGSTAVDMTGWSFDDSSELPGSQSLSAFGTVQPGESVILTDMTAAAFRSNWSLCPPVKIIGGNTNNLGREDEINLYDNTGTLIDRLTYGDQTYAPGSIRTNSVSGWVNATGLHTNTIANWTLSTVADAEASYTSAAGETGSPGKSSRAIVAFDPCLVTNGTPEITMSADSTTNYLDGGITATPAGTYSISGVIGDPTDPAANYGIVFKIHDAETAATALVVTAVSSNTTVVPNAGISISGSDSMRTLKIIPAAVGYATLTVTVSDGTNTSDFVVSYAASAASVTPAGTFYHTGMSDGSDGFAIDDDYYISGDDELDVLNVYSRNASGLPFVSYDYSSHLALPDPTKPEVDVEATAGSPSNPNKVYWLGSMSNGKAPFNNKPNRDRIFATTYSGTGAATSFAFAGYTSLRDAIISWGDANGYNFSASAAAGVDSKTVSGFAAEGMVFGPDNTTLYIGMRAPLVPTSTRTNAVIVPILDFEAWFNNGAPAGSPAFGAPVELDLGGRGFRDLTRLSNGTYVIVAGNPAGSPLTSAIYKWTGNAADVPVMVATAADGVLNMEGVMGVNTAGHLSMTRLQVISDMGDDDLYADGSEAKDFADLNLRKFRSDALSGLDLCLTSHSDTTAVACGNFTWHGTTYTSSATPAYTTSTFRGCDSVVTLHLTINPLPSGTVTAAGTTTFCQGGSVTFTAAAGNSYQWQLNGSGIGGATANSYTATTGGNYSVIITDANSCTDTSAVQAVTVNALPDNTVTAGGATTFCQGDSVLLTAAPGLSYQWMMNGSAIGGATGSSYTANANGAYSIAVSNSACADTSAEINVTVNALPAVPVVSQSGNTLTSTAAAGYQWYYNGSAISGATAQTYNATQDGVYSVTVTNAAGCEAGSDTLNLVTTGFTDPANENALSIYPNPYTGSASIVLTLSGEAAVTIEVYSMIGEKVQTLAAQHYSAGTYTFTFGAKQLGYSSGMYLVRTTVNGKTTITRIVENN